MTTIARLRELLDEATPGPWRLTPDDLDRDIVGPDDSTVIAYDPLLDPADAELIAALRNAAPALLAVVGWAQMLIDHPDLVETVGEAGHDWLGGLRRALSELESLA